MVLNCCGRAVGRGGVGTLSSALDWLGELVLAVRQGRRVIEVSFERERERVGGRGAIVCKVRSGLSMPGRRRGTGEICSRRPRENSYAREVLQGCDLLRRLGLSESSVDGSVPCALCRVETVEHPAFRIGRPASKHNHAGSEAQERGRGAGQEPAGSQAGKEGLCGLSFVERPWF